MIPTERDSFEEAINPPETTLPAPLHFEDREPGQSAFSYWYRVGKVYWQFYKTGIKNIRANRKDAKSIRQELAKLPAEARRDILNRSKFHLLRRSSAEMRRVPALVLLLVITGEWTPLIALLMTPIVPYNCRITRQIQKSRRKRETRRTRAFRGEFVNQFVRGSSNNVPDPSRIKRIDGQNSKAEVANSELDQIARSLDLTPSWIDFPFYIPARTLRGALLDYVVPRRLDYLATDDGYLLQGRPANVTPMEVARRLKDEEVRIAAEERGIDVLERPLPDIRRDLGLWLEISARGRIVAGAPHASEAYLQYARLLTRPNQWDGLIKGISPPKKD